MSAPDITDLEREAVARVLESPHLSMGPNLEAFEEAFAAYIGTRHAVAVSSGTAGLHLCLIAAGVGMGHTVLTTPFSFVASANAALYQEARPIFADVDPDTLNLEAPSIPDLSRAIRRRGPCGAVLPVHTFGQPADMHSIRATARAFGLPVIEDACEAVGAEYLGDKAGTFGDAAVFAFYPNKQMTTGEGGMIVTDREDWATLFRSLRNQGRGDGDEWLHHPRLGYNYRMDEMSAALGLAQLSRIEELLAKRERVAGWYGERLAGVEGPRLQISPAALDRAAPTPGCGHLMSTANRFAVSAAGEISIADQRESMKEGEEDGGVRLPYRAPTTTRMSWFVYVVRVQDRDTVARALSERGIPTRPYFAPIHLQPFYRQRFGYQEGDFPVAEQAGRECLALPFSGVMSESEVDLVCESLKAVLARP